MARQPKIRQKNGHWFSAAGGKDRYFGRVDSVSETEAMSRLWRALADDESRETFIPAQHPSIPASTPEPKAKPRTRHGDGGLGGSSLQAPGITIDDLAETFLGWVAANRSPKSHDERERHIKRFRERHGRKPVRDINANDIQAFIKRLSKKHAPDYVHKHIVSLKAMFNRGIRKGWIPPLNPFATIDPIVIPPKALLESDLPTPDEVARLIDAAEDDMRDLIRLYHATGARTHELIEARVGDYQPQARTLVLKRHKRSKTLREYRPRTITLNDAANQIILARCQDRDRESILFPRPSDGKPHSSVNICERFQVVRKRARVRESITIYSLRHLWISEAMMTGLDSLIVARMAGTSVKMIETTYGHFKVAAFADAQARLDEARRGD